MRRPFKMKGYSYPGKSPIKLTDKEKQANLLRAVPDEDAYNELSDIDKKNFDATGAKVGLPTKEAPVKNIGAALGQVFTKELGEAAMKAGTEAVVSGGVKAGIGALTNKKDKSTRKSHDTSGFSGIKFG